jgi:hypothetical protein
MGDIRGDRDKRIVYCREIDPDTMLHLSVLGDSYRFRRFDGTHPFDIEAAKDYTQMRVCYKFDYDRPLKPDEAEHPVEDEEYWSKRIADLNDEHLAALRKG